MHKRTVVALAFLVAVVLAACSSNSSSGLTGKVWQLTSITEKTPAFQGVVPAADQANYTIEFAADATFSAKADCNTVSGTYTTANAAAASGDLTLALKTSTGGACPEGSLADLYVIGLGNAASYAIASGQLTITLTDGGTLVYK
jgi:heat shock protein HslJ